MSPFVRVQQHPVNSMVKRNLLLAKPNEFFRDLFGGRVPNLQEKIQFVEMAVQRMTSFNVFQNDTYTVEVSRKAPYIHLDITRNDGAACNNWREMQEIKNQIVGPHYEAVQLFPAEERLVDTANEYHLWVYEDPSFRFPVGFDKRFVLDEPVQSTDFSPNLVMPMGSEAVRTFPQQVPADGMVTANAA